MTASNLVARLTVENRRLAQTLQQREEAINRLRTQLDLEFQAHKYAYEGWQEEMSRRELLERAIVGMGDATGGIHESG